MSRKYLVVDDNAEFAENVAEILADAGAEVSVATGGLAALEQVGHTRFDGVVTDLKMPGLSGADLLRRVRSVDPGVPVDKDLYDLPPEELAKVPSVPGSLEEALRGLEADHSFLLEGGVFTEELIEDWVAYKRRHEIDPVRLRPHPWEFKLYYDL